jgi:5'-AMP-activated protein kinase regulatory beta subunit
MPKMRFEYKAPRAKRVLLVGDFTGWESDPKRMTRSRGDHDSFVANVPLDPGRHEYKFLVDGEWSEDPHAESVANPLGTRNSVITVE